MSLHPLTKKQTICLPLLIMACLLTGSWTSGYCRSAFDSDEETAEIFDGDESFDDLYPSDKATGKPREEKASPGFAARFLEDITFTLGYQFSHGTVGDPEIITNYGYLRQEFETLFGGNYFFRFDGKLAFIPRTDHRADARDEDPFLRPRLRELYLQAGYDDFSIKLGNQIIVWGKADTAAITDVVSPRDLSEFIFLDLEDSRFGQFTLSVDIYRGIGNAFFFITPYPDTDENPDDGTRYDRKLPGLDLFTIREVEPEFGDLEYGIRLDRDLSRTEVSLMAGRFYANSPVYHSSGEYEDTSPILIEDYPVYTMVGTAATYAMESILLKFELAYKNRFPLQGIDSENAYTRTESALLDVAAGLEYNANGRYLMTLEISNRHILGDLATLSAYDRDSTSFYYTFGKDFLNQTVEFEYVLYYHINDRNVIHDAQLTYDLTDSIEIRASYAIFNIRDEDSLLWQYREEDRITFDINCFF